MQRVGTSPGDYHAVVFNAMAGEARERGEPGPKAYEPWGRTLGELHNAAEGYRDRRRPSLRENLKQARSDLAPDDAVAHAALAKLEATLESLPATDANFGLIHWDFCTDNIRWGCDRLGVIDFDDRASRVDLADPLLASFVHGYRSARRLDDADLARLPHFMRMSNLLFYASLRIIVDEPPATSEPDWVEGLRRKLRGMIEKSRTELVAWVCADDFESFVPLVFLIIV